MQLVAQFPTAVPVHSQEASQLYARALLERELAVLHLCDAMLAQEVADATAELQVRDSEICTLRGPGAGHGPSACVRACQCRRESQPCCLWISLSGWRVG
jgi:hypothetical protein